MYDPLYIIDPQDRVFLNFLLRKPKLCRKGDKQENNWICVVNVIVLRCLGFYDNHCTPNSFLLSFEEFLGLQNETIVGRLSSFKLQEIGRISRNSV